MQKEASEKVLSLGTAQWGWNVPRQQAFRLLDAWIESGHTRIDCATNYPINRRRTDFRAAELLLQEYVQAHGLRGELQITMKIGSLDNMRTPDINLSPSFIWMMGAEYARLFGSNLSTLMLHWDNRSDAADIAPTLEALTETARRYALHPGLSGILYPHVYAPLLEQYASEIFDIQLKHNIFHSDLPRYAPLYSHPHRFHAYGLNAGGVQLDGDYRLESTFVVRGGQADSVEEGLQRLRAALPTWNRHRHRPAIKGFAQIALIHALYHTRLHGIVIGVSQTDQLKYTFDFVQALSEYDYTDVATMLYQTFTGS